MNKRTISWAEYQGLVGKLARDISISGWRPDYIVGITRGGALPAVMLSQYFDVPMFSLAVSLRDHENTESNCWMSEDAFGYITNEQPFENDSMKLINDGLYKQILIVDDMNDSGATFNWIMNDWESTCMPGDPSWENDIWNQNVKFAVLFDNLSSKAKVSMDFVGEEIDKAENDMWIDFPYEDWWTK
jgi:xanthine phosphoribosyltransferase